MFPDTYLQVHPVQDVYKNFPMPEKDFHLWTDMGGSVTIAI